MKRLTLFLAALLLLSGCSIPLARNNAAPNPVLGRKMVAEKREPRELVAVDRTVCITSQEKYDRVHNGDRVWCVWRYDGGALSGPRV